MSISQVGHVYKRLGVGIHPDRVAETDDPEQAIAAVLAAAQSPIEMMTMEPPESEEDARNDQDAAQLIRWWLEQMVHSPDVLTERMTWFWHDHFATGLRKVRYPYLMYLQHSTVRAMALGPFSDLLVAMAKDPAMLLYLDGVQNAPDAINENYAREVMELHTIGPGNYSQADIGEAARAATGWVFRFPFNERANQLGTRFADWEAFLAPPRHVAGDKTILDVTADHDLDSFLDLLITHPETTRRIAAKVYTDLVGHTPSGETVDHLVARWAVTDPTSTLIEGIVELPDFFEDEAIGTRVKSPVERLVGLVQAYGADIPAEAGFALHRQAYLPFNPPNPAGFPKGDVLLGPYQLIHAFDFLNAIDPPPDPPLDDVLIRLGLGDVSPVTYATLAAAAPSHRIPLAFNSPEFALT